jgi:hypothetical protein
MDDLDQHMEFSEPIRAPVFEYFLTVLILTRPSIPALSPRQSLSASRESLASITTDRTDLSTMSASHDDSRRTSLWSPAIAAGDMLARQLFVSSGGSAQFSQYQQLQQQQFQQPFYRQPYQQIQAAPPSASTSYFRTSSGNMNEPVESFRAPSGSVMAPINGNDTHAKPPLSYASLITRAIVASHEKRLTLNEIYTWIIKTHPFYKTAGAGWKVFCILIVFRTRLGTIFR